MLNAFHAKGLQDIVLCPGSRSGPLALASGFFARSNQLALRTSIDERSAAFFALGRSVVKGVASAVITTSGTAVANLLPAAVEADRSCQPLLLLTADRPSRLKDCGSNQTVNQEDFLRSVCREFFSGPLEGAHCFNEEYLESLVNEAWEKAHSPAGPVHINLPFEEPLHASLLEQSTIFSEWTPALHRDSDPLLKRKEFLLTQPVKPPFPWLDPLLPGVIVAGPWQGLSQDLPGFINAVSRWQAITGWPIFADPLSGVPFDQEGVVRAWDLLLPLRKLHDQKAKIQVLRLGPIPASRNLERWLKGINSAQVLITEGGFRNLDPLGLAIQWNGGLSNWIEQFEIANKNSFPKQKAKTDFQQWKTIDRIAQAWLNDQLPLKGLITEPSLARWLPRLLPKDLPVMLSASSPVRDWIKFAGERSQNRRCFGFRGASGIDGTLSIAMGLCAQDPIFLVTGDLALLHDTNGWLLSNIEDSYLIVFLIDNEGGGIFEQLQLEIDSRDQFERLFVMPQKVDPALIASAHSIPFRQIKYLDDLRPAIEWSLTQKSTVLLKVSTHRNQDATLRDNLAKGLVEHFESMPKNLLISNFNV